MAANNGGGWQQLDFISKDLIGLVIGKGGETIRKFKDTWNVSLKTDRDKLFIQGDPETDPIIKKAVEELEKLVGTCKMTRPSYQRVFSFVYENDTTQQLVDLLLKVFQITKEELNKIVRPNESPSRRSYADYSMKVGRSISKKPPGTYSLQSKSSQGSLVFQHLTPADLDIVNMESLPKITEYSRYDLTIITPKPFQRICYKIFLQKEEDGDLCFITNEEAGVDANEFRTIKEGHGYFPTSDEKTPISLIDLFDPENRMATRVNTFIYADSKLDQKKLEHHLKSLAPFFSGITIRQTGQDDSNLNDDGEEISIPELPSGFELKFYRRVTRAAYRFSERNIIRTSREKVFVQEDTYSNNNQSDVVDLFFESKAVGDVLKSGDWQLSQVVDEMVKLLKSRDEMVAFCLK